MTYRLSSFDAQGRVKNRASAPGGDCPKGVSSQTVPKAGLRTFKVDGRQVNAHYVDEIWSAFGRKSKVTAMPHFNPKARPVANWN